MKNKELFPILGLSLVLSSCDSYKVSQQVWENNFSNLYSTSVTLEVTSKVYSTGYQEEIDAKFDFVSHCYYRYSTLSATFRYESVDYSYQEIYYSYQDGKELVLFLEAGKTSYTQVSIEMTEKNFDDMMLYLAEDYVLASNQYANYVYDEETHSYVDNNNRFMHVFFEKENLVRVENVGTLRSDMTKISALSTTVIELPTNIG